MLKLPPWIYPPKNAQSYLFAPTEVNVGSTGVFELGSTVTGPAWLRIFALGYKSQVGSVGNLHIYGSGFGDLDNFGILNRPNKYFEIPLFCMIPPLTPYRIVTDGTFLQIVKVRLLGWYIPKELVTWA